MDAECRIGQSALGRRGRHRQRDAVRPAAELVPALVQHELRHLQKAIDGVREVGVDVLLHVAPGRDISLVRYRVVHLVLCDLVVVRHRLLKLRGIAVAVREAPVHVLPAATLLRIARKENSDRRVAVGQVGIGSLRGGEEVDELVREVAHVLVVQCIDVCQKVRRRLGAGHAADAQDRLALRERHLLRLREGVRHRAVQEDELDLFRQCGAKAVHIIHPVHVLFHFGGGTYLELRLLAAAEQAAVGRIGSYARPEVAGLVRVYGARHARHIDRLSRRVHVADHRDGLFRIVADHRDDLLDHVEIMAAASGDACRRDVRQRVPAIAGTAPPCEDARAGNAVLVLSVAHGQDGMSAGTSNAQLHGRSRPALVVDELDVLVFRRIEHGARVLEAEHVAQRGRDIHHVRAGLAVRPRHRHGHAAVVGHASQQLALGIGKIVIARPIRLAVENRPVVRAAFSPIASRAATVVSGSNDAVLRLADESARARGIGNATRHGEELHHRAHRRGDASADGVVRGVVVVAEPSAASALVPVREPSAFLEAVHDAHLDIDFGKAILLRRHQLRAATNEARPLPAPLLCPCGERWIPGSRLRRGRSCAHERGRGRGRRVKAELLQAVRHVALQHRAHRVTGGQAYCGHVLEARDDRFQFHHGGDDKARAVVQRHSIPERNSFLVPDGHGRTSHRNVFPDERRVPLRPRARSLLRLRRCNRRRTRDHRERCDQYAQNALLHVHLRLFATRNSCGSVHFPIKICP